jgi:hypothetical protein
MGNPNLTKILIASLVGTFLIAMLFVSYSDFVVINNVTIDSRYSDAFNSISSQYNSFDSLAANNVSNEGLVRNIFGTGKSVISSTINVFVVGLDAIGSFFSMIPLIGNVIQAISNVLPGFEALLGLATTIIGLYIAMSYIKSASNKTELP